MCRTSSRMSGIVRDAGRRHRNPSKINLGHTEKSGTKAGTSAQRCATCCGMALASCVPSPRNAPWTRTPRLPRFHARKQRNTKGTQKDGILCIKRNGQAAYIEYNALFGIEYFPSIEGGLEQIQCRSGDSSITVEGHNLGPTSKTSRPSSATPSAKPTTPNRPLLSACLTSRPSPFASGSNPAAT